MQLEVKTRHLRNQIWSRFGRNQIAPPDDSFVLGETKPNASNTGVRPGITLTPYNQGGPDTIFVTQDNQVFENLDIYGYVRVQAKNTVFRNCYFHGGTITNTSDTAVIDCNDNKNFNTLIEFCTIKPDVPNYFQSGIIGHEFTLRRSDISHTMDCCGVYSKPGLPNPTNVNIEGCYLHDTVFFKPYPLLSDGTHNDCIQIQGGTDIHVIGNNLVDSDARGVGGTDNNDRWPYAYGQCLMIQQNTYMLARVVVEKNWVDMGAQLCTISETPAKYTSITFTLRNNRFGRNCYDYVNNPTNPSKYYIRIGTRDAAHVDGLETNVWEDTGLPLTEGRDTGIRYDAVTGGAGR